MKEVSRIKSARVAKGARVENVPRVPGSKAQRVYLGAGVSQELISDRA